ncbi:MAG: bifunctional 5,10-methylenetetrahydrofolate dehydrogenase/5,10-methenyltetrahydrofolate cyclohydrolase [Candidatus Thermoplasmatota archaeon]
MSGDVIDGRKIADKGESELREKINDLDRPPRLDTIFAGEDEGSKVYLGVKNRGCERVGIKTETHRFPSDIGLEELKNKVKSLNRNDSVDGILVQMPLPGGLEAQELIEEIDPVKDVEGLHPAHLGGLISGEERVIPCTPKGILTMLDYEDIDLKGKEVCIISHNVTVGKPMAITLLNRNATVEVVHEFTEELKPHTKRADILITAVGKAYFVTADMISDGCILIDVGMNRTEDGDLVGDAVYEECKEKADKITPVPGGVGPTTVLSLLENTYEAAVRRMG